MNSTNGVSRRLARWLPMLAVVATVAFTSSASAIPVGVANLLSRKPTTVAKPAITRVGTKSCPRSTPTTPGSVARKPAADKSAGLTSFSRWFL
ncbi:MAG: hypothetical protein WEE89_02430 [Gemmatimonadota bacterium]